MGTAVATGMSDGDGPILVNVPTTADTPEAVVRYLVEWLVSDGQIPSSEVGAVVNRVMRREELGSTGIGRGQAVPHATCEAIKELAIVVGKLARPVDWSAVDGNPVAVVVLIVTGESNPGARLAALEQAVRRLRADPAE